MSNFSQNNVNFTITDNFTGSEKRHAIKGKITSLVNDYAGYEADDASKLVNAVDIDWNNAELQSAIQSLESNLQEGVAVSEITTSGDLLKVIAQLQAQVNTLTVLIKGLYNGLSA